jgi:hypothetical protein
MPPAVLPPGIFSQGRTTLRSFPLCTQPSYACDATEATPSPFVDARLTDPSAPPGQPDLSGVRRGSHPSRSRSGFPSRRCSPASAHRLCRALSSRHPRRAWRSHSTSGSFSTYRAVAPARRCHHAGARCFHGLSALHPPFSGTGAPVKGTPPKRPPPKRCTVDQRQRFCCVASVVSGATRGRRDAGHRAPRSVARRRRGPEGKRSGLKRPSEEGTRARNHPSKGPPRASWGAVRTEVQDTTARGATSQSEDPPDPRGEPQGGSHRRFVQPRHEAEGEEPPGAQSMILTSKNAQI